MFVAEMHPWKMVDWEKFRPQTGRMTQAILRFRSFRSRRSPWTRRLFNQPDRQGHRGLERFYEKFGFKNFGGDASQNWLILKNGDHVIGLFQGMFEKNMLTFNPGWDSNAQNAGPVHRRARATAAAEGAGVEFVTEADESTTGPASFIVIDPDGNPILVDQHR